MKKKQPEQPGMLKLESWSELAIQPVIDRFEMVTGTTLPCIATMSTERTGRRDPLVNINGHLYSLSYFIFTRHD